MKYRREIDGLRAIAVIPVLLFHAGLGGMTGGFVGVDVFFVISGYLITSILLDDLKRDRFSLMNFYERRARRILPALAFVVLITALAAVVLMPADLFKDFALSVVNVGTFTSNFYFYATSGYFATLAEEKPLLHTWSLAVEEQYYLFFPVLLAWLWGRSKNAVITVLVGLTMVSFACGQYLLGQNQLDANFYLIFSRAWELFFGSFLAFLQLPKWQSSRWINELGSWVGMGMIAYSVFAFTDHTPFPGYATLMPVVGTCLLIVFASPTGLLGRILCSRVLVYFGLMSYSLYLWHQPILAFLKMKTVGTVPDWMLWMALVLAVLLASCSLRWIEKPFRNKQFLTRARVFQLSIFTLALMIGLGWLSHAQNGFPQRFSDSPYTATISSSPMHRKCNTRGVDYLKPADACTYLGANITWAALGDSHIVEPAYALAKRLEPSGEGLLHLAFTACPNGYTIELNTPKGCSDWSKEAVAEILARDSIKDVLIGYRYSMHLFGADLSRYPIPPDESPMPYIKADFRRTMQGSARDQYWQSLLNTIDALLEGGKRVHIMYPIPELPTDFVKAATPWSIFSDQTVLDLAHITTTDFYRRRNHFILNRLDSLPYNQDLRAIKPAAVFCDQTHCTSVLNGQALYRDDDHLTIYGADLIIQQLNPQPAQ
jgi:peptidoglycan/LPS O-acetylase OafA/YrhL